MSALGDGVASVAVPLTAVLALHASATQMGYLTATLLLPNVLFSVHAGVVADRVRRPRILMIIADLGRLILFASIPACYVIGVLTLPQLYGVVFVAGTLSVLFNVNDVNLFAALLPPEGYVEGQSLAIGGRSLVLLAGPGLGGLLVQVLSAPIAVVVDALSYLCSAIALCMVRVAVVRHKTGGIPGATLAGLRFIARDRLLGATLTVTTTANFFSLMFSSVLVLYLDQELRLRPEWLGLVLAMQYAGGSAGAFFATRLSRRMGVGRTLLLGSVAIALPLLAIPLAAGPPPVVVGLLVVALFVSGIGRAVQNISVGSIFVTVVPTDMRSRVRGVYQMISIGAGSFGALLGGALGGTLGLRWTLWIALVGGTLGGLWALRHPLRGYRLESPTRTI
jgi:MFS family permease